MRVEKTLVRKEWLDKIEASKGMILTDYVGLSAEDMDELRKLLRDSEGEYRVIKNSVFKISAKEKGISFFDEHLKGPVGVAFVKDEDQIIKIAKVIKKFAKEHDNSPRVKVGALDGGEIKEARIKELASLPSREILVAQVVCGLNSVIVNFVGVLRERVRSIVTVINAIKEAKEKENQ